MLHDSSIFPEYLLIFVEIYIFQSIHPANIVSDTLIENPLDPRSSLKNLNDGNYCTKDDLHSWLAEVNPGKKPRLSFIFRKIEQFSLIRIWNYNRNRVHANRGVKELNIRLDNQVYLCSYFKWFEKRNF